jgi:signal transduction histidine kinase
MPAPAVDSRGESGPPAGVGIASMRHRMRQAGGTLEINSGPEGTTVVAAIPVASDGVRRRAPAPRRGRGRREIPDPLDSRA